MVKVTLLRQVTDGNHSFGPGVHDLPERLAKAYRAAGWTDQKPETAEVVSAEPEPVKLVEIPEDWSGQHYLRRIRLAEALSGERPKSAPAADQVIKDELARRDGAQ
jgi:hypothetical protein